MKSKNILIIATSHSETETTLLRTGAWLEELAVAYYLFKGAGADITLASPCGGPVPIDPKSQSIIILTREGKQFQKDPEAMNFIKSSVRLEEVNAANFDMVYIPGGHGALWDIAENKIIKRLLEEFNNSDKLIGTVSQGAACLLSAIKANGDPFVKDKQLTTFSNNEEESAGLAKSLPFLIETRLVSLGALYSKGANYTCYIVTDGNLTTGQNPSSAEWVAKRMLALAEERKHESPPVPAFE